MGEVYRATDPRLRREVAIKILPAGLANDPERLRRFEQEALAAASLNHPGILAVYDIGVHPSTSSGQAGAPYIVSELLEGATLRETLASGALSVRKVLDYAVQIANGLAAAHEKGIVHRDLKPENLFVTRDGRIKILDFGLAKLTQAEPAAAAATRVVSASTEPGLIVGTVGYMAPEQVRGQPVDHRADIFSFALVLYEMLAGRQAFAAPSAIETMNAILKEDPPDLVRASGTVPPGLDRLVRRCLEKSPDQRFQSARDLAFGLEALASDSDARMVTSPASASGRRRPWLVPALAVLLVVAAAIAGFLVAGQIGRAVPPTFTRLTFRRGTVQSARFASDGQTIVYGAAWQGRASELFSARVGSAGARSLDLPRARILSISSTGEMALRLSNGTLARAPLAGGIPREIIASVVDAAWAPDGQTLAIVRSVGTKRRLEFPPGNVLYESAGFISDIAIAPDGGSMAFVEAPRGIGPLMSIGIVDRPGTRRTVSEGWRSVRGVAWSGRGDEIWFAGSRTLYGSGAVFAVTPTGRSREVLKVPGGVSLYDVFNGKILIGRTDDRLEAMGLAPGDTTERDLSWFDYSGLSDLSPDGRTMIITESGESGLKVYLRKTDGSPAVELGDGGSFGMSPDGHSLIVQTLTPLRFGILPIGPGETRYLSHPGFDSYWWANWFPDGKRILFAGTETAHGLRLYVENLDGSGRHPIAPEGTTIATGSQAISPDGRLVAAIEKSLIVLYPTEGGSPTPVPGVKPGDVPTRWTPDGRFLYVYRRDELPVRVYRVDVASGSKELWKTIGPADPAGVTGLAHLMFTTDGHSYAYNYLRSLSDLYLVDGLK
jgi:hypothetical protein